MSTQVLIVDYHAARRKQLRQLLEAKFDDYKVTELQTSPPTNGAQDTDADKLRQVKNHKYDLLVGHIGGNPSGYECLKTFKANNENSKAVIYTKLESIPIKSFAGLKLADAVFKRSDNDNVLFEDADEMMDLIKKVMDEKTVNFWKNPFKDKTVAISIITLITVIIGLLTALIKAFSHQ